MVRQQHACTNSKCKSYEHKQQKQALHNIQSVQYESEVALQNAMAPHTTTKRRPVIQQAKLQLVDMQLSSANSHVPYTVGSRIRLTAKRVQRCSKHAKHAKLSNANRHTTLLVAELGL